MELHGDLRVVAQELLGLLTSLAELVPVVGVPGAGLLDDALLDCDIKQTPFARDAIAKHDVELGEAERRGHLVLGDLGPHPVANVVGPRLDRLDSPYIDPHGRIELESAAAGGGFWRPEHHADLLS